MKLKIIVEKGEDGYFVAHCPSLKSCWSQGKTKDETLKNIREAIELFLEPAPDVFAKNDAHQTYELELLNFLYYQGDRYAAHGKDWDFRKYIARAAIKKWLIRMEELLYFPFIMKLTGIH